MRPEISLRRATGGAVHFGLNLGRGGRWRCRKKLFDAIVDGKAQLAQSLVEEELKAGADPVALISETMIPAMDEVGKLFQEEEFSSLSCCLPDER